MISGPPPGLRPSIEAVKQLEFELEAAWKKLSAWRAQCECAYTAVLRTQAENKSSAFAFAEWQSARAGCARALAEYDRIDRSLAAASSVALAAVARRVENEPPD
jgi:hypothetical protein